jgi:flagellar assembly protein FliH
MALTTHVIRTYQSGHAVTVRSEVPRAQHRSSGPADGPDGMVHLAESEQQAATLLLEAREQAAALLQEVESRAAALQAAAQARGYQEGYQQGTAEGREAGENALAGTVASVHSLLQAIQAQRAELLARAEPELVVLAVAMVEKMIGPLAQRQRSAVAYTANQALSRLAGTGPFRLRVHPEDVNILKAYWQENPEEEPGEPWTLVGDRHVAPGGCLVECGPAVVDATLPTQMRALLEALDIPGEPEDDDH